MDISLLFILFALVAGYATVAYFAVVHGRLITIVVALAGIPFALVFLRLSIPMTATPFQIAASLFRTRVLRRG